MAYYTQEYLDLEEKMLKGEITDKEFLKEYNRLIEQEANDMIESSGFAEPHEHI